MGVELNPWHTAYCQAGQLATKAVSNAVLHDVAALLLPFTAFVEPDHDA